MSLFNILSNALKNLTKDDNKTPNVHGKVTEAPDFSGRLPYQLKDTRERLRMAITYHRQKADFIEEFLESTKDLNEEASNTSVCANDTSGTDGVSSESGLVRVILPEEEKSTENESSNDNSSENTEDPDHIAQINLSDKITKLRRGLKIRGYENKLASEVATSLRANSKEVNLSDDEWDTLTSDAVCYDYMIDEDKFKIILKADKKKKLLHLIVYSRGVVYASYTISKPVNGVSKTISDGLFESVVTAALNC